MLKIQLAERREIDPDTDAMGRSYVGGYPGMSEENAWLAGRGVWKMDANRALKEDIACIVLNDNTIVAKAEITGIVKHGNRYEVEGDLLLGDPDVGTKAPGKPGRNPIQYV